MMVDMIQTFLYTINERKHVLELLQKNERLLIEFKSGGKTAKMALANGEYPQFHDMDHSFLYCGITGELSAIKLLLEGKAKLRILASQGQLNVSAPFRTVLLLESLFYLTKADRKWAAKVV